MKSGHTTLILISIVGIVIAAFLFTLNLNIVYPATASIPGSNNPVSIETDKVSKSTTFTRLPDDTLLSNQWAYSTYSDKIGQGKDNIVLVAILDTGIDTYHEDLSGKVIESIDFTQSRTEADRQGHGTHVAGILAANVDNSRGIAGLAPHARLLNVKVADDEGMVFPSSLANGIKWAADRGAKVINISLCIYSTSQALEEAVVYAWKKGAVIVAAAGNQQSETQVPGCYPNVISVGALDESYNIWQKSNRCEHVTVYAPGVNIYTTAPDDAYVSTTGTSMAAAHISAAAAEFMTSAVDLNNNGRVNDEVFDRIKKTFNQ